MAIGRKSEMDRTPERAKRVPISGSRNVLTVEGQDNDFVYRWVNDKDGRIDRFKAAYYELVKDDVKVGDKTVDSASGNNGNVSKDVGNGITAYLMRIKKEWFLEDQAAKQVEVDRSEESMKRELNKQGDGSYGGVGFK